MKIDWKKYLQAGLDKGFAVYQIAYGTSTNIRVSLIDGEIESQTVGNLSTIGARGLLDGRIGSFVTDALDKETPLLLADSTYESALYGKEDQADNFFDGKARYKKARTSLKECKPATLQDLQESSFKLYEYAKKQDNHITQVEISLSYGSGNSRLINNLGLNCKKETKVFCGSASIIATDTDGKHRSGGCFFYSFRSLDELREKARAKIDEAVLSAVDFFRSGPVEGRNYKVVLSPTSVSSLLSSYVSQLSGKAVKQHLSVFEGKLSESVASKKLTIRHTPHVCCLSAASFDSEGVPTQDFTLIEKGILKNYFHSLESAHHFHVEPNGCACGNGSSAPFVLSVKPGRYDLEELFQKAGDGIYINDISGLNSGIDDTSLNFSLPCQGYLIKNGKKDKAVSMILMTGNLLDLFNDVVAVGKDVYAGTDCITPSLLIKKIAISGK